jgi:hypothetical protein
VGHAAGARAFSHPEFVEDLSGLFLSEDIAAAALPLGEESEHVFGDFRPEGEERERGDNHVAAEWSVKERNAGGGDRQRADGEFEAAEIVERVSDRSVEGGIVREDGGAGFEPFRAGPVLPAKARGEGRVRIIEGRTRNTAAGFPRASGQRWRCGGDVEGEMKDVPRRKCCPQEASLS